MASPPPPPPPPLSIPAGYGTIPSLTATTFTSASTSTSTATLRPWRSLLPPAATFSRPYTTGEGLARLRRNLDHFRFNYALVALILIFLSILFHPLSLLLFLALFAAWLFLYFSGPLVVLGRTVNDRTVLFALGLVTVVAVVLTGVGTNVLVALVIAAAVVGVHATLRSTDDMLLDEADLGEGGLQSVVGSPTRPNYRGYTSV